MKKHKPRPTFPVTWSWVMQKAYRFIGFGFGSGLAPFAPGTFGTVVALPLAYLWLIMTHLPAWSLIVAGLIILPIGIKICSLCERDLGVPDYGGIVIDEIGAMILILGCIPFQAAYWIVAFILFRLLDAIKPFPISWFDRRFHGGFGIMLDDYIAAVIAIAVMVSFHFFI